MALVTIYLKTFRRPHMLPRAIESVLRQSFGDYELVVHDDASGDETESIVTSYGDPRIRYILAEENLGGRYGDTEIMSRLGAECQTEFLIHLNDDDFYYLPDLFARQVGAFRSHPFMTLCCGGSAQRYDHPIELPAPPPTANTTTEYVDLGQDTVFTRGIYPSGIMSGFEFLRLYSEDYPNRNIVHGATMFRADVFKKRRFFNRDFPWQAGAALSCGAATLGDVYYIDEPCLINSVSLDCASFRGTQKDHFYQCLASIAAGYADVMGDPEMKKLCYQTMWSAGGAYFNNKIGHKGGFFRTTMMGDISHIMEPPITGPEFLAAFERYGLPVAPECVKQIEDSDL